ncbi:PREDICTED: glutathione S-transferase 4-like [Rhagoletis zephyria]|uniref:glutathione S-transferase 4-like n=1 Tax=Rhagoletis zephyria TaxID=28612 RepID=UPI0008116989|nr:PREDICTED: glutathione S-transferase 4-like [Rhagoletis zephyria]
MPLDLYYHPISPPSKAVLATAKYLNISINVKEVDLFGGETRTSEYLKLNPSHTVPTLVDNGFAMFESRAILQYLANKYAPDNTIYPKNPEARAQVDKILFFDASSYYASLSKAFIPILIFKKEASKEALDELAEKISILESLLGEQKFFAGENITLADISLGASVPVMKMFFKDMWPKKLESWYIRLSESVPQLPELK